MTQFFHSNLQFVQNKIQRTYKKKLNRIFYKKIFLKCIEIFNSHNWWHWPDFNN